MVIHRVKSWAIAVVLVAACGPNAQEPWLLAVPEEEAGAKAPLVRVTGTVEHSELEGGFYLIRGSDGKAYDPMNLPDEFKRNGTPVEADVVLRPDLSSIRQVGTIVEVVRIRRAAAGS